MLAVDDGDRMVKQFTIDFDGAGEEERKDIWADIVRPLYFVSPVGLRKPSPNRLVRSWLVDRLIFCEAKFGAMKTHRTKSHVTSAPTESLVIQSYQYGMTWGETDGEQTKRKPGEINITDYNRQHRAFCEATHVRSLIVAHKLVGYDPSIHPATMRIGTETALGHVLQQTIGAIFKTLDHMTDDEAPAVAEGLIALLRNVLFNDPLLASTSPEFCAARSDAIRRYIVQQIGADGLSVEAICSRFNISRATLYRDFKPEGGFDRYILERRLEAAFRQLAFGTEARGVVTQAAEHWGFSSTTYFSREFRRKFGFAPSDILSEHQSDSPKVGVEFQENFSGERNLLESFMRRL